MRCSDMSDWFGIYITLNVSSVRKEIEVIDSLCAKARLDSRS